MFYTWELDRYLKSVSIGIVGEIEYIFIFIIYMHVSCPRVKILFFVLCTSMIFYYIRFEIVNSSRKCTIVIFIRRVMS